MVFELRPPVLEFLLLHAKNNPARKKTAPAPAPLPGLGNGTAWLPPSVHSLGGRIGGKGNDDKRFGAQETFFSLPTPVGRSKVDKTKIKRRSRFCIEGKWIQYKSSGFGYSDCRESPLPTSFSPSHTH